jgi:hypothetical protein
MPSRSHIEDFCQSYSFFGHLLPSLCPYPPIYLQIYGYHQYTRRQTALCRWAIPQCYGGRRSSHTLSTVEPDRRAHSILFAATGKP